MESKEHNGSFVQCQYCGNIYYTEQKILSDDLIINVVCPNCGYKRALNCGDKREDIYLYMDATLDPRYYLY